MGNLVLNGQTVLEQVGTARPEFGAGVPTGCILDVNQYRRTGAIDSPLGSIIADLSNNSADAMSLTVTSKGENSKFFITTLLDAYNSSSSMRGDSYLIRSVNSIRTTIDEHRYAYYKNADVDADFVQHSFMVLDTPGLPKGTSITYILRIRETAGVNTNFGYGDSGGGSSNSITVMEIAA
jgi:hypothetical protein